MNKKFIKIINIVLVLSILFLPFTAKAETIVQKGDLRCPVNLSNNVSCTEIKDNSSNITEVRITVKNENIEVTKIVKKTETLGKYEVYFNVKGDNLQKKEIYKDTKIVLILDMSKTVKSSIESIKNATNLFYNNLKDVENVKVAILQFAQKLSVRKTFEQTSYTLVNYDEGLGTKSYVEKALATTEALLSGSDDALKYVVLLGDGQYWAKDDTDVETSKAKFKSLRDSGAQFFMIQYAGGLQAYNEGYKKKGQYNKPFIETYIKPIKWWCNYGNYDYSTRAWCENNSVINYETIFNEVANNIKSEVYESTENVEITLVDQIGSNFSIENGGGKTINLSLKDISANGIDTEHFFVDIDEYSPNGWHPTNDSFTVSYTINGTPKTLTSNDNPEVYWIQEPKEIDSCYGIVVFDTIENNDSDESKYYEKKCLEGYLKDNKYYNGFSTTIRINNLDEGTKEFDVLAGLGFPAYINLSTNITCQYIFKYEKFQSDYQTIQTELNQTSDQKEIASLTKQKENMDKILDNYIRLSENDLTDYSNRFALQEASLKVDYPTSGETEISEFKTVGEVKTELDCTENRRQTINGKNVVNKTCYLSLSKDMNLSNVCLNMKTGEQEPCTSEKNQLNGGSNYYIDLKQTYANIYVDVTSAGYSENLNIKLKDCSVVSSENAKKSDIVLFRQIDVADPFIKNYDNNRVIGKNYSNSNYNFVNIIKSDIWSESYSEAFDYQYYLSKTNVDNIRKDTAEEGVDSYLGRNCYLNANNKYICDFTRNLSGTDTANQPNLFTNFKINR